MELRPTAGKALRDGLVYALVVTSLLGVIAGITGTNLEGAAAATFIAVWLVGAPISFWRRRRRYERALLAMHDP